MIPVNERVETPKIGKELLRQLAAKEITIADFDRECAYWEFKSIDELPWKPYPEQPKELSDYYEKVRNNKDYKVGAAFWQQAHIQEHTAKCVEIKCQNKGNIHWLCYMKKYIPDDDISYQVRIEKAINTYPKDPNKSKPI